MTRLEVAGEDCRAQLLELRDVIQVQGGIVTDTLVTEEKPKRRILGIF